MTSLVCGCLALIIERCTFCVRFRIFNPMVQQQAAATFTFVDLQ
jgi:hypothetical protein